MRSSSAIALKSNAKRDGIELTMKCRNDHFDDSGFLNNVRYVSLGISNILYKVSTSFIRLSCKNSSLSDTSDENERPRGNDLILFELKSSFNRFTHG